MIDERQMLPINTMLQGGKYRVVRYMASGGFGNTYEVEHVKLGKRLALKEFFMRGVCQREGLRVTVSVADNRESFDQMRTRFLREAQMLAQIDEPHVMEVSDFFEENQTAYYVMKLIDGESLAAVLKRQGAPLPEAEVRRLLGMVLPALQTIHRQGIYHLDLKPGNMMVNATGHLWLIDFGASRQLTTAERHTLSTSTGQCYTPGYAPSEQVSGNGKRIGPWSDFYALGATIYNLLTMSEPPSPDDLMNEGEAAFHFPAWVSPHMRQMVVWLMRLRPADRPQRVEIIMQALSAVPTPVPPSAPVMPPVPPSVPLAIPSVPPIIPSVPPVTPSVPPVSVAVQRPVEPPAVDQPTMAASPVDTVAHTADDMAVLAQYKMMPQSPVNITNGPDNIADDPDSEPPRPRRSKWKLLLVALLTAAVLLLFMFIQRKHEETTEHLSETNEVIENLKENMVYLQGDSYLMGSGFSEAPAEERPAHKVTLKSFYIGRYEVTQEEWEAVMGNNPSAQKNPKYPVTNVNWDDCQRFIERLNSMTGLTFRLPTEAEWEYAALGGKQRNNNDGKFVDWAAWHRGNSHGRLHEVGGKDPNAAGLYDMLGNVWEWCDDAWYRYSDAVQTNPTHHDRFAKSHVGRGGSWDYNWSYATVTFRTPGASTLSNHDLGFRLAR